MSALKTGVHRFGKKQIVGTIFRFFIPPRTISRGSLAIRIVGLNEESQIENIKGTHHMCSGIIILQGTWDGLKWNKIRAIHNRIMK